MTELITALGLASLGPDIEALGDSCLRRLASGLAPMTLGEGALLFEDGDDVDAIYLVLSGRLRAFRRRPDEQDLVLGEIGPGELIGEFKILTGGTRGSCVAAVSRSEVARCPRGLFLELCGTFASLQQLLSRLAHERIQQNRLAAALERVFGTIEAATLRLLIDHAQRVHLRQGEMLFAQGAPADGMSVLLAGRLEVVVDDEAIRRLVSEIHQGEVVGEMGLIDDGAPRSASAYALRDSDLITLSRAQFEHLVEGHPERSRAMLRFLSARIRQSNRAAKRQRRTQNITIVPIGSNLDVNAFTTRLVRSLSNLGRVTHLHGDRVAAVLGTPVSGEKDFRQTDNTRLASWLEEQEASHDFVVYEAEARVSAWTRRCTDQADTTLLVATASCDPTPGDIEKTLYWREDRWDTVRRSLVLVHPDGAVLPSGTSAWLTPRNLHRHHHLRWDRGDDFDRIARIETGHAIGLVLGGGGARTAGHLGVIQALHESGVPIDLIGGTSGGGQIAMQYSLGMSPNDIMKNAEGIAELGVMRAFTLPLISLLSPDKSYVIARRVCGDTQIEDLWLPSYTVSFNLSTGEKSVHTSGPVFRAMMATGALPAVFPPVVADGQLLVDGGVIDNLPVSVMKGLGASRVIASDVSPRETLTVSPSNEPLPSGWRLMWSRLNPFVRTLTAPNIVEIILQLVAVNDPKQIEETLEETDLVLQPPVQGYTLTRFDALDEICKAAYEYTMAQLIKFRASGGLGSPKDSSTPGPSELGSTKE